MKEIDRSTMSTKILIAVIVVCLLSTEVTASPQQEAPKDAAGLVCGKRPIMDNPSGASNSGISHGTHTVHGAWPWLVSLQEPLDYEEREFTHVCGGFIINRWWVVTPAHCFRGIGEDYLQWRALIGAHKIDDLAEVVEIRKILKKIEHKGYNLETQENDIALLKVNNTIPLTDYIQPACLPRRETVLNDLTECYVAGWGYTNKDSEAPSNILQEAKMNLIEVKKCNSSNWYNRVIRKYNLCAGYEQKEIDTCQGDSGGPLMCRKPQTKVYTVIGISSWGEVCAQAHSPGVYTSTQYFLDWIAGTMVV